MRILICPDLHLDITGIQRLDPLIAQNPDWIIVAGDLSGWDRWDIVWIAMMEKFPKVKFAFIPGNHDFYTQSEITVDRIIPAQKDFCHSMSIHYLTENNLKLGDITFVGSCLWYDYSFVEPGTYTQQELHAGIDHKRGSRWNDMRYIHNQLTDKQFTKQFLAQFKQRLKEAEGRVIAITHLCPKKELNAWPPSLFSAYSGTTTAGKELDKLGDRLVAAYCGHTHKASTFGKYENIGNDYGGELKYKVLDV